MGLFEFLQMPFGQKNSDSVYARFVHHLLRKVRSPNNAALIDDVLVFTKTSEQNVKELRSVFELHWLAGIKLRPNKTKLFQSKTKHLGFDVSAKGIGMRKSYIDKVMSWPSPQNN